MRIPLPERFQLKTVMLFTIVLVIVQFLEGTNVTFSLLTAVYVSLFALAFNAGGGIFFLAGAYVFFQGLLAVLLGILWKCYLGEPGDSNLAEPLRTLAIHCLGMAGLVLAAALSRRFLPKRSLLSAMSTGKSMKQAAIGCLLLGIVLQVATSGVTQSNSLSSAIGQVNNFIPMAVILATTFEINDSGGKRSSNWIVLVAGTWIFVFGAVVFSKQGMFTPFVAWLIPATVLGFNFSKKQLIIGAVVAFYVLHYLVPYSQYGRMYRDETGAGDKAAAVDLLLHPQRTRELYVDQQETEQDHGLAHYFNSPQGLFDREEMLSVDDSLITWSDQGNFRGLAPTIEAFENIVPHFIWKGKPQLELGNDYARAMGVLPDDDTTTGIAFSPEGDAYHQASWFGVGVIYPAVAFLLFMIGDSLCGDTRKSPWGLLLIVLASHMAPEGLIAGSVYLLSYSAFAVLLTALLSKYVLPIISKLLMGSERTRVRRTSDFQPLVGRGARINPLVRQQPDSSPPQT